ncbi:MAG: NAD(P)-dependent glycerol-3-phosphate dehydrogenase [Ruminococcus sp.]|nr:NAD(P)-dependent glycerol-3-phosphate dehydrogenase [Ruminococcus sp.]
MAKITIIGAGGFGICLAITAFRNGHDVTVWDNAEQIVAEILRDGENKTKLPGVKIPKEIAFTTDPSCITGSVFVVFVVPSRVMRIAARSVQDYVTPETILINASKGLEEKSFLTMSQVIQSVYPNNFVGVITGPSHAEEVGRGVPTSVVAASNSEATAIAISDAFSSQTLRIYLNSDPIGCEIGGALKNIIALAAGVCDGLQCGDNTKAALMTRGIHEITKLGVKMGGKSETFGGLSGVGDLIVTCCSMHSRNRRAGILIGQRVSPKVAVEQVGTVEGYYCCHAAWELAQKYDVSMPITEQLYHVLFDGAPVEQSIQNLMCRPKKKEYEAF